MPPYSSIVFGTDGWRGLIGSDVNPQSVAAVAQALADYLLQHSGTPCVAVGYDGRSHSREYAGIVATVLSGNGIETLLSDRIVPTPVVSFIVRHHRLAAGVMVTASHNPPQYNGVKFKASYGGPFLTGETQRVESFLGKHRVRGDGTKVEVRSFLAKYVPHLESLVDLDAISRGGVNVVLDSMAGAGGTILAEILSRRGCRVRTIDEEPAADFHGRSPEPIEKNLGPLIAECAGDPDVGVGLATDGDADRLGVVLDGGRWLSAQETILLLADHVVNGKKAAGAIVKTASVTDKLTALSERAGRLLYDVQVGFKYICERMINEPVAIGCEESGGYGYGFHVPERDGVLSGLLVAELMAHAGTRQLSTLVTAQRERYGPLYYDRVDHMRTGAERGDVLPVLASHAPDRIGRFAVTGLRSFLSSKGIVNGLKFTFEGTCRWLLVRVSETEPLLRIYAEGNSDDEVSALLDEGKRIFERTTLSDPGE